MFTQESISTFTSFGIISLMSVYLLLRTNWYIGRPGRMWWMVGLILPWVSVAWHALWHLLTDMGYPIWSQLHMAASPLLYIGLAIYVVQGIRYASQMKEANHGSKS